MFEDEANKLQTLGVKLTKVEFRQPAPLSGWPEIISWEQDPSPVPTEFISVWRKLSPENCKHWRVVSVKGEVADTAYDNISRFIE